MAKLLLHKNFRVFPGFHFIFCSLCFFNSCDTKQSNTVLDHVYIQGIHDDPDILRADSFFLRGKLKEAALLFGKQKKDNSKQLYCQARLAEMDYYLRILYGKNHVEQAKQSNELPIASNSLDSLLLAFYHFYHGEDLNNSSFLKSLNSMSSQLGKNNYFIHVCQGLLGEYYYKMNFNLDSTNYYYNGFNGWLNSLPIRTYESYWTNIRLTKIETYHRDHVESVLYINNLIADSAYIEILDSIHLAYAFSKRGNILNRLDKYEDAYKDILMAIHFTKESEAIPVYQEALGDELNIADSWGKDSLWNVTLELLKENIESSGMDYININKYIGSYYYVRGDLVASLPAHEKALSYYFQDKYPDVPTLATLAYMHSDELEFNGKYHEAITVYRIADIGYRDPHWNYDDLVDSVLINSNFYFVSLSKFSHIYFSWFQTNQRRTYLDTAEQLALLAYSNYYRSVDAKDESTLITFSYERNIVYDILCSIVAEKYLRYRDTLALEDYYQYAEENRGAIFWRDVKSQWTKSDVPFSLLLAEQQLNAQNKQLLLSDGIDQAKLLENNKQIKEVHAIIEKQYPEYYRNQINHKIIKLQSLADSLDQRNTCLLSFHIIENQIFLLWIGHLKSELYRIPFSKDRQFQVKQLINMISVRNSVSAKEYNELSFQIYSWLIPEKVKMDTSKIWSIVPDGILHRLNFEALTTRPWQKSNDFDSLSWLILDKTISYSPLIKSWLLDHTMLPTIEGSVAGIGWSSEETIMETKDSLLPDLPGSIFEMNLLRKYFPSAKIYAGKRATKQNFIKLYTDKDIRLLHLSVHGQANSTIQDDIRLYFRSPSWSIDTLFGYELLPMTSDIETIILSACESSEGKVVEGEGQYNLARYFLANGARNVYSSLWVLDDNASQKLFNKFYELYAHSFNDVALRTSKCLLIKSSEKKFSLPYYWASLIQIE